MNDDQTTKKTVLLVEDELPFRQIYRDALQMEDFEVLEAEDGEEAIETMKKRAPDVVLLDLILPKRNGFDVLQAMKDDMSLKNVPVIVYSVLEGQPDIDRAMKLGAQDYTIKGVTPASEVAAKMRTLLHTDKG